ncbi:tripartite tricarboxylate transporter permease [Tropicimonas marinistellae]|uniref:tripartite tricarboxylate transporter permease n=1 Tax=Tropicimonas marinistellae TaxID=1739787 RepID=UPI0008304A9E|nr:tripartite tricarboxylate transporter permease [Tropicimonas marinistellae]
MTEILDSALEGLRLVFAWPNLIYPVAGTLLSMLFAFLPGLNGVTLMAIAITMTLSWDPVQIVLIFGAFVGGATFMGSITSILFNVPGSAPNAATLVDGHPMAEAGKARTAIACAASSSALGSTFGIIILLALLPFMRPLILSFGPPEFLLLAIWGLSMVAMLSGGLSAKGIIMTGIGLLLAFIGTSPLSATDRFTMGTDYLVDGLPIIPMLLGLFAVSEAIHLSQSERKSISGRLQAEELSGSITEGCLAPFRHAWLTLRCSFIGTIVGIVPGIGGTVASFVSYGHAVQTARDKEQFGKGDIRGVIAPEAASDAKDGGSLFPVLAFGIPGSEGTVLLLTALMVHGIVPGRALLDDQLPLVFALIWSLFFSNWLTSILGVAISGQLARITLIQTRFLVPVIFALVAVAAIVNRGRPEDLILAAVFGLFGYALKVYRWPRVPLVIALVLGGMFETNLHLTMRLYSFGRIDLLDRPVALVLLALLIGTIVLPIIGRKRMMAYARVK